MSFFFFSVIFIHSTHNDMAWLRSTTALQHCHGRTVAPSSSGIAHSQLWRFTRDHSCNAFQKLVAVSFAVPQDWSRVMHTKLSRLVSTLRALIPFLPWMHRFFIFFFVVSYILREAGAFTVYVWQWNSNGKWGLGSKWLLKCYKPSRVEIIY